MQRSTPTPPPLPRDAARRLLRRLGCAITLPLVFLIALAAGLYLNETWQGRKAWRAYVAEMEAAGERLDLEAVIPPPVPDAENFAAVPLFKRLFEYERVKGPDGKKEVVWTRPDHHEFVKSIQLPFKLPERSWRGGAATDFRSLEVQGSASPEASVVEVEDPVLRALAILSRFDPVLAQVEDAASRPKCRFPLRYEDGFAMLHPALEPIRNIGQILRFRASARLASGDVDGALADIRLIFRISDAVGSDSSLLSYLVHMSLREMVMQPLWEGVVQRRWSDEHLEEFQKRFTLIDHAARFQQVMRTERNVYGFPGFEMLREKRGEVGSIILGLNADFKPSPIGFENLIFSLVPEGWFDLNKAQLGRDYQRIIAFAEADPPRFYRDRLAAYQSDVDQKGLFENDPRTFVARLMTSVMTAAVERSARAQGTTDLTLVALCLERHHLRHSVYPGDLAKLDPEASAGMAIIPPDRVSGSQPHYRRIENGRFLLYYDGWNQKDDGGEIVYQEENSRKIDFKQGDWVWPQPIAQ